MFPAYFKNSSQSKMRSVKNPVSCSSIGRMPKNVASPYVVHDYNEHSRIRIYKPQIVSTRNCVEYDYQHFCKDDSKAFRLLLRNKYQLGKPKISLQRRTKHDTVVTKKRSQNSFPCKKAPYVPSSFLNSSKKKKLTANLSVKKPSKYNVVWKEKEKSLVSVYPTKKSNVVDIDQNNNQVKNGEIKAENRQPENVKNDPLSEKASCNDNRKQADVSSKKPDEFTAQKNVVTLSSHIQNPSDLSEERTLCEGERGELKRKITEEEFLKINKELLKDIVVDEGDGITIPVAGCHFFMDDRRPSASHIMNEHLNRMLSKDNDNQTNISRKEDILVPCSSTENGLDEEIAQAGMFVKCGINIEVIDEYGRDVKVNDQFQADKSKEEMKDHPMGASSQRKEELRKLLKECTEIAKEIQNLELQD